MQWTAILLYSFWFCERGIAQLIVIMFHYKNILSEENRSWR